VEVVRHEVELVEYVADLAHLDLLDLVRSAGEGGGQLEVPAGVREAQLSELFAYRLEEVGEVLGVRRGSGVILVACRSARR